MDGTANDLAASRRTHIPATGPSSRCGGPGRLTGLLVLLSRFGQSYAVWGLLTITPLKAGLVFYFFMHLKYEGAAAQGHPADHARHAADHLRPDLLRRRLSLGLCHGLDDAGRALRPEVDAVFLYVFALSVVFLVCITALMIYFVVRYRRKRNPRRGADRRAHGPGDRLDARPAGAVPVDLLLRLDQLRLHAPGPARRHGRQGDGPAVDLVVRVSQRQGRPGCSSRPRTGR